MGKRKYELWLKFEVQKVETSAKFDESGAWLQTETLRWMLTNCPIALKIIFRKNYPEKKLLKLLLLVLPMEVFVSKPKLRTPIIYLMKAETYLAPKRKIENDADKKN